MLVFFGEGCAQGQVIENRCLRESYRILRDHQLQNDPRLKNGQKEHILRSI